MPLFNPFKRNPYYKKTSFSRNQYRQSGFINTLKKGLLRLMVIMAVCLAVYQLNAATNPVDFYLQVAGNVEAPAMNFSTDFTQSQSAQAQPTQSQSANQSSETVDMIFSVNPYAPVKVLQNDNVLGVIDFETRIPVQTGTLVLDAKGISYPVTVQIDVNNETYSIDLKNEVKNISIKSQ